jgi:heme a synthase
MGLGRRSAEDEVKKEDGVKKRVKGGANRVSKVFAPLTFPLSVANLIANVAIIVTGGAVRLTGSGLGCPTWPRCTDDSYVPRAELGLHGAIEFGNRLLTFALVAVAIGCWFAVRGNRLITGIDRPYALATLIAFGVPAQALIGGVSVLTELNPWVVSLHLMVSLAMVALCVVLVAEVRPGLVASSRVAPALRGTVIASYAALWMSLYLGTVVTGSGPHAGDAQAPRNGLDSQLLSHVHAGAVYVLVALTVGVLAVAWRAHVRMVVFAAAMLLGAELAQGVIGVIQLAAGLPALLVGAHLFGAALVTASATFLLLSTRSRR